MAISHHEFRALGSIIAMIGILGILTNFTVLLVFFKKRYLINQANIFIISLTIGNLAVCVTAIPFAASSNIAERWLIGNAGCIWYGFANTFFGLVSISTLTIIAIHRYLIICKTNIGLAVTPKLAVVIAILAWLYALFWSILPVFGWAHYAQEGLGTWCSIQWSEGSGQSISYIICMFIFCFFLPISTMIFMYVNIFMQAHKMTKSTSHEQMHKISLRRERRLAKMSLAIWFSFLIAWTPYAVMALISVFDVSILGPWAGAIPAVFAKTATIYTPIVYVGMNDAFKVALISIFPCLSHVVQPQAETSVNSLSVVPTVKSQTDINKVSPKTISDDSENNITYSEQ